MLFDTGIALYLSAIYISIYNPDNIPFVIIFCILSVLLPDIDIPVEYLQRKKLSGKKLGFHQKFTHYPIIYIIPLMLILQILGQYFAILFGILILSHLIHDSVGTGWGIKWLWPINHNRYKFFANPIDASLKNIKPIVHWEPSQIESTVQKYGDDNWIKNYYLKVTLYLIIEIGIFLIGLISILIAISFC